MRKALSRKHLNSIQVNGRTFVGCKKTKFGCGQQQTILNQLLKGWVIGDRSAKIFRPLWDLVQKWQCYFYVTDGWKVYPGFIRSGDQIICKTYMTSDPSEVSSLWERASVDESTKAHSSPHVGENTRLRYPERPIASQNTLLFAHQ